MSRTHATEDEPLLGQPGDVTQQGSSFASNLWTGTAVLAQAGIWIMAATVWALVFQRDLMLFSAHPVSQVFISALLVVPCQLIHLLNSAGILLLTQAILVVQPTHTAAQKQRGTQLHALSNGLGAAALIAGLVVIEYNKFSHSGAHFGTAHNVFGLITSILVILQALVGITQFWTPSIYGGVDSAKAVYKYHRAVGYATLTLGLVTICLAVDTPYNSNVLHLKLWVVVLASVLVLLGVLPRVKMQKLGFKRVE